MYRSWCRHRGGAMAAELTLFTILSALPLLLIGFAGLGALDAFLGAQAALDVENFIIGQIERIMGDDAPVMRVIAELFENSDRGAITIGALFAGYAASRAMISLVGSLDTIFAGDGRSVDIRRGWVQQRVVGVVLAIGTYVVGVVSVVVSRIGSGWGGDGVAGWALEATVSLGGYLVGIAWLAYIYRTAPLHEIRWRHHLPGSVVAVVGIDLLTRSYTTLVGVIDTNAVFGVIGSAISLLWWAYLASCLIILGAEITAVNKRSGTTEAQGQ